MLLSFAISEVKAMTLIVAGQPAELVTEENESMVQVHDTDGVMYSVDSDKLESYGIRVRNIGDNLFVNNVKHTLFNEIATEIDTTIKAIKNFIQVFDEDTNNEIAYFNIWKVDGLRVGQKVEGKVDWCMVVEKGATAFYDPNSLASAGRFWNNCISMHWLRDHFAANDSEVSYVGLIELLYRLEAL